MKYLQILFEAYPGALTLQPILSIVTQLQGHIQGLKKVAAARNKTKS